MNQNLIELSQSYLRALRWHLKQGPRASFRPALSLGRQAVVLGLETLELARIHERALAILKVTAIRNVQLKRAEVFFTEALTPIVETHRAARQSQIDLSRLNETLDRRKSVEAALKKSSVHYSRLLKDSLNLQEGLRQLTHRVLTAQEDERKKIRIELQDEIAQTLIGIDVRLLSLKQEARINTKGLKKEITSTQRLVARSARSVRRGAREFRNE